MQIDIYISSGNRTHDFSFWAGRHFICFHSFVASFLHYQASTSNFKVTSSLALCNLILFYSKGKATDTASPFLNSALDGGEWSASNPCRFTPGERVPITYWIGGWAGPRVGLDAAEKRKILYCQGSNPDRPAHLSSDWVIPTPFLFHSIGYI
jgi:hypothetical protein